MDPVSAVQIASAAFTAASGALNVYMLFKDAQNIDRTAEAFANEIHALGTACGAAGRRLQDLIEKHSASDSSDSKFQSENAQIWQCLACQLPACEATISELKDAVFCSANDSNGQSNFCSRVFRQIKLNLKVKDIAEVRNRIQSHTTGLQLVLQTITV